MIDMTVYSAVCVAVLHDGIDEGAGCFVQVPRLDDELREGMIVFLEEELGEARCAFFGLWVMDADFIERFSERLSSPDFHLSANDVLDLLQDFPLSFEQTIPRSLYPVSIDADAAHGHVNETWEQLKFEVCDRPKVFFAKLNGLI